jgi:two-component system, chemotaxis family, chemotaxis protein CheY
MNKTILVVDDFTTIRLFICEMLEKKGYRTLNASNGKEAFQTLIQHAESVDMVLTDYNMPDCTGLDLLKKIKATEAVSKVPVVFFSSEMDPDKIKGAKESGLATWIKKPYRPESFFEQIAKTLGIN